MCFGSNTVIEQQNPTAEQTQSWQMRNNVLSNALSGYAPGGNPTGNPVQSATGINYFTNFANSPFQMTPGMSQAQNIMQQAAYSLPNDPITQNPALNAWPQEYGQFADSARAGLSAAPNEAVPLWMNIAQAYGQTAGTPMQAEANPLYGAWSNVAGQLGGVANSQIQTPGQVGTPQINYQAQGRQYDPTNVLGQNGVNVQGIDPTGAVNAARNYMDQISSPAIRNALEASGMGRSGAEAEALANAGAMLELPIHQQILGHQSQGYLQDASTLARQQETSMLADQNSNMQAQRLTASSNEQADAINAAIAQLQGQFGAQAGLAQYQGELSSALQQRQQQLQFGGDVLQQMGNMGATQQQMQGQMDMAQRQGDLNYGQNILSQLGQMGMGQQQLQTGADIAQRQAELGFGSNSLQQLGSIGVSIPALQSQQYQNALLGAQTNLQAASLPQQLAMQDYQNRQNFLLSLMGATPIPGGGGSTTTNSVDPGALNTMGSLAMIGSMFYPS